MDFEILKAQWEELEDWKKLLIILVLSGVLAYAVYFFILSSKIEEKQKLEAELNQKNMEFEVIKRNVSPERRAKLIQELEKEKLETERLQQQLEDVKSKFKPRDDLKKTINFVTNLANKNGVILENISILSIEDVYLKYNPSTDKVETVSMGEVNSQNNRVINRLAPRKHKRGNKENQSQEGENANNDLNNNLVHLKRFRYSLSIKGTTRGIVNLIRDIVKARNFINVYRVSLKRIEGGKGLVQANLEVVSYTEGGKK